MAADLPPKVEDCHLCGGPVVQLPDRMGLEAGYTAGLTCLGCAPLDAVPMRGAHG